MALKSTNSTSYAKDLTKKTVTGGNGADNIDAAQDTVLGSGNWTISGGNGNDYIRAGAGDDVIWGDSTGNSSTSDNGADTLLGGGGKDAIHGGNGADLLEGDAGADQLWGDRGGDTFKYVAVSDSCATGGLFDAARGDVINDFRASEGDKLDLGSVPLTNAPTGTMLTWSETGGQAYDVWASNGIVYADTNGDGVADMAIKVLNGSGGNAVVGANDFLGINHDPTVAAPLTASTAEDAVAITRNLLTGASDSDAGDTANLAVTNVSYTTTIDNVAATTPAGVSVSGSTLTVDTQNDAFDSLAQGQTMKIVVSYDIVDGHGGLVHQTETVTITGVNDAAVITGDTGASGDETNAPLTLSGTLSATDVDNSAAFNVLTDVAGDSGKGTFSIDAAGHWSFTANSAYDALNEGESVTDSVTVSTADGTTQVINVTIHGTNDAAVLSSATADLTETNSADDISTSGTLTISDVDSAETFVAQTDVAGSYGKFSIGTDGQWTYVADSAHNEFVKDVVYTDTFDVTSADGTHTSVTVNITGTNDAAVITGIASGSATEAGGVNNGTAGSNATGDLNSTDVDGTNDAWTAVTTATASANGYGTYTIDATGHWTFAVNNADATVQALNTSSTPLSDSFTVTTADGTSQVVTVSIHGANDAAVISGTTTGSVTEDSTLPITATGTLTDTDVDNTANTFQVVTAGTGSTDGYGTYAVTAGGDWTYTLNNSNTAVNALNTGQSLTDHITVLTADGTSQVVAITINGHTDIVAPTDTSAPTAINFTLNQSSSTLTGGGINNNDTLGSFAASGDPDNTTFTYTLTTTGGGAAPTGLGLSSSSASATVNLITTNQAASLGTVTNLTITATDAAGNSFSKDFSLVLGTSLGDSLTGSSNTDLLYGFNANDTISGGAGDDVLVGGASDDTLRGGAGVNQLFGAKGADTFVLDSATGKALILDFWQIAGTGPNNSFTKDTIGIDQLAFAGLGTSGALNAANFAASAGHTTINTAVAQILYDTTSHEIYYHAAGSSSLSDVGHIDFSSGTSVTASDFLII